jgi:hypothetical protein
MGADKNSSRRRWRLQQDEHGFQHTSLTHYPSWLSPRSHWSATGTRNQQTTFRAKAHQHAQRKLARLATCAAPVRQMACASQTGGCSNRTTSVPESLSDFFRPWNKNTPKNTTCKEGKPYTNLTKQLQTDMTNSTKTQRHMNRVVHPRQIPQVTRTGQTVQEHRSDRCSLSNSGLTTPAGQLLQIQTSISRIAPRT